MRGQHELILSDGKKIPMRFCTWSLKRFCQLQGIGPTEIGNALSGSTSLDAIVNLLKSAAEYPLYSQGITPSFTEIEVCDWIDDMGGMAGQKFQELMSVLSESMNSGIEEKITKPSKKGEVKKKLEWIDIERYSMGECQVLPHLFWEMTMAELDFIWYGYRHNQEQQWVIARWQTTLLINIQLPKGKKVRPKDLLELDCDIRNFVKQRVMTSEELEQVIKSYEK